MRSARLLLLATVVALVSSACSRKAGNSSQLNLRLPPKSSFEKSAIAQSVSQIGDFDCLAVAVSGPETALSANSCTMDSGSQFKMARPFGPFTFLNESNQDISISVPKGSARVVRLIAFTTDTGACTNLEDVNDPYVVAESAPTDLTLAQQTMELKMAFDSTKGIDDCTGPDLPSGVGSSGPYLRIEGLNNYDSGEFPGTARPLTRGVCYPVALMTYEPCHGGVACTVRTPATDMSVTFLNSNVKFFNSSSTCEVNSAPVTTKVMTAGVSPGTMGSPTYPLWMRIPLDRVNLTATNLANEVTVPADADSPFTMPRHSLFYVGRPIVKATGLVGPSFNASEVPFGGCASTATTFKFYAAGTTGFTTPDLLSLHEGFSANASGLQFLDSCAGSPLFVANNSSTMTGWFKQNGTLGLGTTGGSINKSLALTVAPHAGKWIVAGGFATFAGTVTAPILRLMPSGLVDFSFKAPSIDGEIHDVLELPDGSLLVAGAFTTVDGATHKGLVKLHSDGSRDASFTLQDSISSTPEMKALARHGNNIYVGGLFGYLGGQTRTNLAVFDITTQAVGAWAPNPDAQVLALLVDEGRNALFAGGYFLNVNDLPSSTPVSRAYLASFTLSSGALSTWSPNAAGYVRTLAPSSTFALIAGGDFTYMGGSPRSKIAAFNGNNALPALDSGFNVTDQSIVTVRSLKESGTDVYVGGDLDVSGYGSLIRVPKAGGVADSGFQPEVTGTVKSIGLVGSDVAFFGSITRLGASSYINGFGAVQANGARSTTSMNSWRSHYVFDPAKFESPAYTTDAH